MSEPMRITSEERAAGYALREVTAATISGCPPAHLLDLRASLDRVVLDLGGTIYGPGPYLHVPASLAWEGMEDSVHRVRPPAAWVAREADGPRAWRVVSAVRDADAWWWVLAPGAWQRLVALRSGAKNLGEVGDG